MTGVQTCALPILEGDYVEDYENSNGVVGVVILKFSNFQEMEDDIKSIKTHIKVIIKEETSEKQISC